MASATPACVICMKKVLDQEKAIGCDGPCERWFHTDCIKMSNAEYAKFAGNKKLSWNCNRVDCFKDAGNPINQLVAQISDLAMKMDHLISKVDCLKSEDIAPIKEDIKTLNTKICSLEPRLLNTESRITTLEQDFKSVKDTVVGPDTETVISEMNDRSRRAANVIIYNLRESTSSTVKNRQDHDLNHISNLNTALNTNLPLERVRTLRLGKPVRGKNRPLKVIFQSPSDARMFNNGFSQELVSAANDDYANVSIGRDRTPKERQYLQKVRQELEERKKKGETSLTIKYTHGIPAIVKGLSKNE